MQVKKQELELDMEQWTGSKLGKEYIKAVHWHSAYFTYMTYFTYFEEYIMWNARLGESWARIKIAGRNINNLRYTDDTILKAERKEELNSLLMKVKEESEEKLT